MRLSDTYVAKTVADGQLVDFGTNRVKTVADGQVITLGDTGRVKTVVDGQVVTLEVIHGKVSPQLSVDKTYAYFGGEGGPYSYDIKVTRLGDGVISASLSSNLAPYMSVSVSGTTVNIKNGR